MAAVARASTPEWSCTDGLPLGEEDAVGCRAAAWLGLGLVAKWARLVVAGLGSGGGAATPGTRKEAPSLCKRRRGCVTGVLWLAARVRGDGGAVPSPGRGVGHRRELVAPAADGATGGGTGIDDDAGGGELWPREGEFERAMAMAA